MLQMLLDLNIRSKHILYHHNTKNTKVDREYIYRRPLDHTNTEYNIQRELHAWLQEVQSFAQNSEPGKQNQFFILMFFLLCEES
jgi:predicted transcriptional regulator